MSSETYTTAHTHASSAQSPTDARLSVRCLLLSPAPPHSVQVPLHVRRVVHLALQHATLLAVATRMPARVAVCVAHILTVRIGLAHRLDRGLRRVVVCHDVRLLAAGQHTALCAVMARCLSGGRCLIQLLRLLLLRLILRASGLRCGPAVRMIVVLYVRRVNGNQRTLLRVAVLAKRQRRARLWGHLRLRLLILLCLW